MINAGLFSSKNHELRTPIDKYREWDKEFHFNTDPCTTSDNPLGTKCFYTKEQDGLNPKNKWIPPVFINPPYGRELPKWVKRAAMEAQIGNVPIVMLIPARTDTRWFHDYIYGKATEIRFLKGRLVFGELKNSAPFHSMLVIFSGRATTRHDRQTFCRL
jgi:phage N-6-adenine-methyltransferase